jgi:kynureninase
MPATTGGILNETAARWGSRLIQSWNEGWWLEMQQRIGDKIAQLIGARPGEVVIADSTSVNLFKLAAGALQAQPGRTKIITDDLNFPSDLYILQGLTGFLGRPIEIQVVPSDGIHGPADALTAALDTDTALLTLSHTVFKSAYTYHMAQLTDAAHRMGALTLWDLSHSAGSYPVLLTGSKADLAVGCTYKHLNGGPGAPAFLYVRKDLQGEIANPLSGWAGQNNPFQFNLDYQPVDDVTRYLTGTPPVLSIAAIEPGVDLLLEAGMDRLRAKSVAQTQYLVQLWESELAPRGYVLNSPRDASRRGSHISLGHVHGWAIDQALIEECRVLPDFRAPDNIRLGIAPIYTSYTEIFQAVRFMAQVVDRGLYKNYRQSSRPVT